MAANLGFAAGVFGGKCERGLPPFTKRKRQIGTRRSVRQHTREFRFAARSAGRSPDGARKAIRPDGPAQFLIAAPSGDRSTGSMPAGGRRSGPAEPTAVLSERVKNKAAANLGFDGRQGHDQQGECAPDEANLFLEHRDVRLDGYEIRLHGREIRLDGREIRRDPVKGGGDRLDLGADGAISPATEFRPRRLRQVLGEEPAGEEDALAVSGRADPVLRRRPVAEVDLLCAGFVRPAIPLTLLGRSTGQGTRDREGHHRVERPGIRDEVPCLGIE